MTRWFGRTMVAVAIVFFVWSRLEADSDCIDGPCADDVLLLLGFLVEAVLAFVWVVTAVVVSVREGRKDDSR